MIELLVGLALVVVTAAILAFVSWHLHEGSAGLALGLAAMVAVIGGVAATMQGWGAFGFILVAPLVAVPLAWALRLKLPGRASTVFNWAVIALAVAWVTAFVAMEVDFKDADGFIDCWPSCSYLQEIVGYVILYGGVASLIICGLAGAALFLAWGRERSHAQSGQPRR